MEPGYRIEAGTGKVVYVGGTQLPKKPNTTESSAVAREALAAQHQQQVAGAHAHTVARPYVPPVRTNQGQHAPYYAPPHTPPVSGNRAPLGNRVKKPN